MFLHIALRLFENGGEDLAITQKYVEQAIDLDLRIKLINEELVTMTEREVISNSGIFYYLSGLAKLYSHSEHFTAEMTKSIFSSWFVLNQQSLIPLGQNL